MSGIVACQYVYVGSTGRAHLEIGEALSELPNIRLKRVIRLPTRDFRWYGALIVFDRRTGEHPFLGGHAGRELVGQFKAGQEYAWTGDWDPHCGEGFGMPLNYIVRFA